MSDQVTTTVEAPAPWWRTGKAVIVFIAIGLLIGAYFYRQTVPPAWLRAFGAEIALRASADPNAPAPEDTREATPRGLADNPLICFANIAKLEWDRVVFVTHEQGKTLESHETLSKADWPKRDSAKSQLVADDRYQLVVLMKDNAVVDAQTFFTFWADLSGLSRHEGFGPETAIFTAESHAGRYVVSQADATLESCPKQ